MNLSLVEQAELAGLPGGVMVLQGIEDLTSGRETVESLLALLGHRRMERAGLMFAAESSAAKDADYRLYALLGATHGREAHARYNALLAELVSFERALERRHSRRLRSGASHNGESGCLRRGSCAFRPATNQGGMQGDDID